MQKQNNVGNDDVSAMDALKLQSEKRSFTDKEIRAMPKAFQRYVASANGNVIPPPPGWLATYAGVRITKPDKRAAMKIFSEPVITTMVEVRPDSFVSTNGGRYHYTPDTVTLKRLNGTEEVRANAAIPASFKEPERYANVQAVAAFAAQVVRVKDGAWSCEVPVNSWNKILPRDGGMDAVSLVTFGDSVAGVLNASKTWRAMDTIKRQACTGLDALVFIRTELDQLSLAEYTLLNTRLVMETLRPMEQDAKKWFVRVDARDTPVVLESSYQKVDCPPEIRRILKEEGFPAAYWYHGGYAPGLNLPPNVGRFKETKERYDKMTEVQVGNDSSTAILSGMRGFSSLTDDFGKRIQFILGATLSLVSRGEKVDIQLSSVGDVVLLKSSLNYWERKVKDEELFKKFCKVSDLQNVRFILPKATDGNKVPAQILESCIFSARESSTVVAYLNVSLPTAQKKGESVDYRTNSQRLIPPIWHNNKLVAYMPVYDSWFWPDDPKDDSQTTGGGTNSSNMKAKRAQKYFIFEFGTAANWCGVVSTFAQMSLAGYGFPLVDKKWDQSKKEDLVFLSLERRDTWESWLKKVASDCAMQIVAFMRPVSRYSPISNLPFMSKTGVTLMLQKAEAEDGSLIKNLQFTKIASRSKGREVVSEFGNDPPDEYDEGKAIDVILPRDSTPSSNVREIGGASNSSNFSNTSNSSRAPIVDEFNEDEEDNDDEEEEDPIDVGVPEQEGVL